MRCLSHFCGGAIHDVIESAVVINCLHAPALLTNAGRPSLNTSLDPNTTITVVYGDQLSLSCSVEEGGGEVTWSWYHNGSSVGPGVATSGGRLDIASAVEEDSGSYQCFAGNSAGTVGSATAVRVRSKLKMRVFFGSLEWNRSI